MIIIVFCFKTKMFMLLSENLRPTFNDSMIKEKTLMLTINLWVTHVGWWFTTQPKCPWFCQASDRVSCSSIYLTYPCHKHSYVQWLQFTFLQSHLWDPVSRLGERVLQVSSSTGHRYCTEVQGFASTGSQHSFSHDFPSSHRYRHRYRPKENTVELPYFPCMSRMHSVYWAPLKTLV